MPAKKRDITGSSSVLWICVLTTVAFYGFNEQKTAAGGILSAVFVRIGMHKRLNCYHHSTKKQNSHYNCLVRCNDICYTATNTGIL